MTTKRLDFLIKHGFRRRHKASFTVLCNGGAAYLANRLASVGEAAQ